MLPHAHKVYKSVSVLAQEKKHNTYINLTSEWNTYSLLGRQYRSTLKNNSFLKDAVQLNSSPPNVGFLCVVPLFNFKKNLFSLSEFSNTTFHCRQQDSDSEIDVLMYADLKIHQLAFTKGMFLFRVYTLLVLQTVLNFTLRKEKSEQTALCKEYHAVTSIVLLCHLTLGRLQEYPLSWRIKFIVQTQFSQVPSFLWGFNGINIGDKSSLNRTLPHSRKH